MRKTGEIHKRKNTGVREKKKAGDSWRNPEALQVCSKQIKIHILKKYFYLYLLV